MKRFSELQADNCSRWTVLILFYLLQNFSRLHSEEYPIGKEEQEEIELYMQEHSKILGNVLEGYDKRFIPAVSGKPLRIQLEVKVSDVLSLDDTKMESELIVFIRQTWYDYRLSWDNSTERVKVREHLLDKIWLPDARMSNLKDMKRFDGFGGINMNIYRDGRVYFSQLALVKISCPMDLRHFPMDKQTCFLNFSSFAYGKSVMFFELGGNKITVNPVRLPQFDFVEAKEINNEGVGTKVTIGLVFQRRLGYYILQIYVPSVFLVLLSWLAFLVEPSNIADRLALEVTMILSIVFLLGGINTSLPHVSYPKASDWYIMVSFWFIFMALLETMLVYRMTSQKSQSQGGCGGLSASLKRYLTSNSSLSEAETKAQFGQVVTCINEDNISTSESSVKKNSIAIHAETTSQKSHGQSTFWVDRVCIVAFPALYVVFNIIYWWYFG